AVAAIVALAAINYIGVRRGNFVNIVLTIAKVSGLAALPLLALFFAHNAPAWTPVVPAIARPGAAFGVAMIAVLWTYDAWYCVTWVAREMKHHHRDLPRALFFAIGPLTLTYVLVHVAYIYTLPMTELAGTTRVAERAATRLVGPAGAGFVAFTVVLSTF